MSRATRLSSNHYARTLGSMITLQVVAVMPAAHDAVTLLLALPGSNRAPSAYLPGQFITVLRTLPT
jgi:ferredoxin-NADP reductase